MSTTDEKKSLQRWSPVTEYAGAGDYFPSMAHDADGEWVTLDDANTVIAALRAELTLLKAERAADDRRFAWLAFPEDTTASDLRACIDDEIAHEQAQKG